MQIVQIRALEVFKGVRLQTLDVIPWKECNKKMEKTANLAETIRLEEITEHLGAALEIWCFLSCCQDITSGGCNSENQNLRATVESSTHRDPGRDNREMRVTTKRVVKELTNKAAGTNVPKRSQINWLHISELFCKSNWIPQCSTLWKAAFTGRFLVLGCEALHEH